MKLQALYDMPPWDWPEDAGKMFQDILADREAVPAERMLAAEMAGEMTVVDGLAGTLLKVVTDNHEPAELRARAAIALGPALEHADTQGFDDSDDIVLSEELFRHIRESFQKSYHDPDVPKETRRRILEASIRAPLPWHQTAIEAAAASGDREWLLTAVFCMRFVGGFEPRILEALQSEDPDIRYEAVVAAGNWEIKEAWPDIADLLATAKEDDPLLFAAIEAAANLGLSEAIEPLEELLLDCEDDDLIDAIHESLAMLGADDFIDDDYDEEEDD